MIRSSSLRALFCLGGAFAVAAPLAGCVVAAVGGAAAGGYTLVTEERTPQQLAQDEASLLMAAGLALRSFDDHQ